MVGEIRHRFHRNADALLRAQADGDIAAHKDAEAMAAFLVNNIWGKRVTCKGEPDRHALAAVVDGIMARLQSD